MGEDPLPGFSNYLRSSQPVTHVPGFGRVRYASALPGIDLIFASSNGRRMELHLRLSPGADAAGLGLLVEGATPSYLDAEGNAVLDTAVGPLLLKAPVAWQIGASGREPVAVEYVLDGATVRLALGLFDASRELFIDPVIAYQLAIGGSEADAATAVAVDAEGNAYVAGHSRSSDFPTTAGAFDQTVSSFFGADDAFVMKRDATGTLVWSTALGGIDSLAIDRATAIALDSLHRPVVVGWTTNCFFASAPTPCSSTIPVPTTMLGKPNAFLAKLTADGSGVVFAKNFGGSEDDRAQGVAVAPGFGGGDIVVVGRTESANFPVSPVGGVNVLAGGMDAFVSRFFSTGALESARYLGGSAGDEATSVVLDDLSRPLVAGTTFSSNFPSVVTGTTYGGGGDAFVARLRLSSLAVDWSRFQGGSGKERGTAITTSPVAGSPIFLAGDRVVTGQFVTFPSAPFVAQLLADGSLSHEITLGLPLGEDHATSVAYSPALSRVYVAGYTSDPSFPVSGALGPYAGGASDAFIATLAVGAVAPVLATPTTFLGTSAADQAHAIALRGSQLFVAGSTGTSTATNAFLARIRLAPALPDAHSTNEDTPLSVAAPGVLANDDLGGLALKAVVVSPPSNAAAFSLQPDGSFTYSPIANFYGADSFVYGLAPASGGNTPVPGFETATVTITVTSVNDLPVAVDDAFALPLSGTLVVPARGVLANDTDLDGEALAAQLASQPTYGTLSLHPLGGFSYVADRDFPGQDVFTYRARDAAGATALASVTLTGAARSGDESITVNQDTPVVVVVLGNDPGLGPNAPPETEVAYCYDGYDADCGGSDAPATAFAAGRLTRIKDKPGAVAFAFDGAGRQVRETRTLVLPGETRTLVTETAFDANGNPVSKTHPTGVVVERGFDETDREVSVAVRSPGGATTPLLAVGGGGQGEGWYPYGGLRAWRAASGTLAFTIEQDASGWVTRTSVTSVAAGESAEATYRYASDGNVIAIDSPLVNNVGHDSLGRITFDRGSSYAYDDAGNRLSGPGGAVVYPDPSSNRWTSAQGGAVTYAFDAAGNVTRRGDLALVTADDGTVIALDSPAGGKSRFFRDHRNLRVATSGASGNERFVHSAGGDLELRLLDPIAEPCGSMGQIREVTPVEHYVYVGGRRVAMVAGRLEGTCGSVSGAAVASVGASHLYFADKMDLARAVYREIDGRAVWSGELDAFAVPMGAGVNEDPDADGVTFAQAFRLPGQQEIRGTELSENWNRILDRVVGRYLQPDPAMSGDPVYSYASGRPLRAIDPAGLYTMDGSCENWSAALALFKSKAYPDGPTPPCKCGSYDACEPSDLLTENGGEPNISFKSNMYTTVVTYTMRTAETERRTWPTDASTNCSNEPRYQAGGRTIIPPRSIVFKYGLCTGEGNIQTLANKIAHEFTHWCRTCAWGTDNGIGHDPRADESEIECFGTDR